MKFQCRRHLLDWPLPACLARRERTSCWRVEDLQLVGFNREDSHRHSRKETGHEGDYGTCSEPPMKCWMRACPAVVGLRYRPCRPTTI